MFSYRDHNKGAMLLFLKDYPVIDLIATGDNIKRLRVERGLTVRDLQKYFGFEEPQAIYKWQRGQSLPTVDNLYALGNLFGITMDEILVPVRNQLYIDGEQQGEPCCSHLFSGALQRDPLRRGRRRRLDGLFGLLDAKPQNTFHIAPLPLLFGCIISFRLSHFPCFRS